MADFWSKIVTGVGRRSTRTQGSSQGTGDRATRGGKEKKRHKGTDYSWNGHYRPW